ncbi:Man1-Src1p-C-terminal domain-containing protein [Biscogniauxia mediterranea]|nr:Man1-Src1p-C-terminal domain-containing protein [Biscogniauxia mediterranea]
MSDSEGLEYLQPGFDPKSLTIPRLRSILVAHNIPYSSSAKKAQLVEIFNEQLVPQSKKIIAARARAKRSSKGIFDADQGNSNPFEEHEELLPPPPQPPRSTRRSRSPRKVSARIKSEEPEHEPPMPPPAPSPSKRKVRASSRPLQTSDTDTAPEMDGGAPLRRGRKVEATPRIKTEESDGFFRRTSDVFTTDNPFQSGSSPPPVAERTPSHRRKTGGIESSRSVSRGLRRQTNFADDDVPSMSSSLEMPPRPTFRQKTPEPPMMEVEAGEEFTPEEQLELASEEATSGETAVMPSSRQSRPPKKSGWSTPISMFLVTALGVYAGWYRQEKIAVGYCGVGRTGSSIPSEIEVPEWAQSVLPPQITTPQSLIDMLEPECEPCPAHAYCYSDFSVQCEQDYIIKPHPFALGGVVPLPPTCEPDGEKVRRVQSVADRAIEELRERTAKYECGGVDEEGAKVESPAIEEQELKQIIDRKRSKKMNNQEFEDLWGSALGEIKNRDEVVVEVKEASDPASVPNTYLTSTSLARIPIACTIRRSIRLRLARHRFQISVLIALLATAAWARSRLRANRAAAAQVPALVDLVLERLARQKRLGDDDLDDAWLFLPNLRDDVLRSVHSLAQRERIWQRVKRVVEQNSNVRTSQREGRSGEVGRAWEWIGPTAGDAPRRRKSIVGGAGGRGEDADESLAAAGGDKSRLHQKWEESRPVF